MIRFPFGPTTGAAFAALALAACTPTASDTGAGVGFQDYGAYVRGAQQGPASVGPVVVPPPGSNATGPNM